MEWDRLINEADLAALLPGEIAVFARPVKAALTTFLSGLPRRWQDEVARRQLSLPLHAPLAERLGELARSCPVLHKLGQVLARDQRLAPELRRHLRTLESLPPTVAEREIRSLVRHELGSLTSRQLELSLPALAEASVAVVVPFRDLAAGGRPGVLKLLKPNIEERLAGELELLCAVGQHLDERCHELGLPELDYRETFEQVREKLACEIQFEAEQRHLRLARRLYADSPAVLAPELFAAHSTARVTAMERVFGLAISDAAVAAPAEGRRLARRIVQALVARPLMASGDAALFHCDPHAGNLMLAEDGRLAILDWSLVTRISEEHRATLARAMLAAIAHDGPALAGQVASMSVRGSVDRGRLKAIVGDRLGRIRDGELLGVRWLTALLDEAAQQAGLRPPAEVMLFRKALLTLEGVVAEVADGDFALDDAILPQLLAQFVCEWPTRWLAPPTSREFATRISNVDLAELAFKLPLGALRYTLAASRPNSN